MADTKLTGLTGVSVPVLTDITYLVDVSDTTDDAAGSSRSLTLERALGLAGVLPGGRLTTESGVGVSTSDRTSQSTLYYTPHVSDYVRLYDGTRVKEYVFTERSLALSGLTSGKNYDVWLYDSSGTLTLELLVWTDDTTRATALAWQSGLGWVKSGDATRLYLGTIRTTGTTTTEDSGGGVTTQVGGRRFVWNAYNRVVRPMSVIDTTDGWTYASSSWRSADNAAGNKVEYVCGLSLDPVSAEVRCSTSNASASNAGGVGVGVDSTSANSASIHFEATAPTATSRFPAMAVYSGWPGIGYHYLAWIEYRRAGTVSYDGDVGVVTVQSGMSAEVMA